MIRQNGIKLKHYEADVIIKGERHGVAVGAKNREQAIVYLCEKHDICRNQVTSCIEIKHK